MRRLDYGWVILATGFIVLFFGGGSRFTFGLMLKPMTDELHWTRSSLSLAVTAYMVVSALAMPLVGRLMDRYEARWVMAGAVLLGAAGIGLMGLVTQPWHVFALYGLVYAVGSAGTSVSPVGVVISRWFSRRRGIANSAAIAGNAVGQLLIIAVLTSVLTAAGWRLSYRLLGAVYAAVALPLVLAALRPRPQDAPGSAATPAGGTAGNASGGAPHTGGVLTSRQFWLLLVVYSICGFQDFFVATHVVAFATDEGVSQVLAGNLLALMGLMGVAGVMTSGLLADAWGATRPAGLCFLLRIAIFGLVLLDQGTASIVAFALLYGLTFLITAPLTVIFAGNIFGMARLGTVSGAISMVHQITGGLGAYAGAFSYDRWASYDGAFALMLALSLIATLATALVRDRRALHTAC